MLKNPSETRHVIEHLHNDIKELSEKQSQALQSAIYLGFSRAEKNEYDERVERIEKLRRELALMRVNAP
jgi:polyhydroxyalkanoate synthesis regulator phasin